MNNKISLTVNGVQHTLESRPNETLSALLRERLRLTGTKIGCEEAECGACTVLVDGEPVVSCIYPAERADGKTIVTIEGLSALSGAVGAVEARVSAYLALRLQDFDDHSIPPLTQSRCFPGRAESIIPTRWVLRMPVGLALIHMPDAQQPLFREMRAHDLHPDRKPVRESARDGQGRYTRQVDRNHVHIRQIHI